MASETCPVCSGSGTGTRRIQVSPSYYTYETCSYCGGSGRISKPDLPWGWKQPPGPSGKGGAGSGCLVVIVLIAGLVYFSPDGDDAGVRQPTGIDNAPVESMRPVPLEPSSPQKREQPVTPQPAAPPQPEPLAVEPPEATPGNAPAGVLDGTAAGAPVRVGGAIAAPAKIKDVRPQYPPIARSARVEGVVIVEVVVGADGTVQDARALRSILLLDRAALDAVRQWVYNPTVVDGVSVPVVMTVAVQFTLNDR